ncbi:unnamed protein product [Nippostrongylus brasiliensis]|uniref:ShKT domain-containing protein n=1 Tax=Nippostrongylus brasiliensis TaxID=27835 RepID=A0A158R165_NIPBR|nr:unnamed protein product [Nippostrongylus brasiliensis]
MLLLAIVLVLAAQPVYSQVASKAVIDFCTLSDPRSCGAGTCIRQRSGNRCKCPHGWMGRRCARPCQDVYRSCKRWEEEDRCSWTRPISPFFTDNCALSCGLCRSNGRKLPLTLPPILDNIAWFVGRWESKTMVGENFPVALSGPYREVLEVQISDVPIRTAVTMDGRDIHTEVGFMTSKPFLEDTGFVEFDKPKEGDDLVAIESVGNNGFMLIEEGVAKRMFTLVRPDMMEERVIVVNSRGETRKWLKRFVVFEKKYKIWT